MAPSNKLLARVLRSNRANESSLDQAMRLSKIGAAPHWGSDWVNLRPFQVHNIMSSSPEYVSRMNLLDIQDIYIAGLCSIPTFYIKEAQKSIHPHEFSFPKE